MGNGKSSRRGFTLLEVMVSAGLLSAIVLAVLQTIFSNQIQLKRLGNSVKIEFLKGMIVAAFSGNIGGNVLRNFQGGPSAYTPGGALPNLEKVLLSASRTCRSAGADYSVIPSEKNEVHALMVGGPIAVKGQSLSDAPGIIISDMYLVQLTGEGSTCPAVDTCVAGSCNFLLRLELTNSNDQTGWVGNKTLEAALNCRVSTLGNGSSPNVYVERCAIGGQVTEPSPSPSPCLGDLNQDGETDVYDQNYVLAFWGAVPTTAGTGLKTVLLDGSNSEMTWNPGGTPAASPGYLNTEVTAIRIAQDRADLNNDGFVDGGDFGMVLVDQGCKATSQTCFENSALYQLYIRAARFASPGQVVDGADLSALLGCIGTISAGCMAKNLDGKCGLISGSSSSSSHCHVAGMDAVGYSPASQGDVSVLNLVWALQGLRNRFKTTGCSTSKPTYFQVSTNDSIQSGGASGTGGSARTN